MSVIIYTTPSCSYCTMAKNWFNQNKIKYTEYNVARDMRKADEMVRKSGQMGVPVTEIDGKDIVIGFDKDKLKKLLDVK